MKDLDKNYLKIAMPAAFEGVFMILLLNIDIILVGKLGALSIAAVSIFTQPRMMLLTLARSLAAALTLVSAKYYGSGRKLRACGFLQISVIFWGAVLFILHIMFFHNMESLLMWMGAESSYINEALNYADIALVSVFFTSISAIMQAVLLGFGDTASVMRINVIGNIVNILFSIPLIFGLGIIPALGVEGAAIGTVIGSLYSFLDTCYSIKRRDMLYASPIGLKRYFKEFMPIFGGVFAEQGFERVGMVIYTKMAASLGAIPYAVHAICMNFCDFYYQFAAGLGKASMVLAGHAKGGGNHSLWRKYITVGVKWSLIFSTLAFLFTFIFREEIFKIYSTDAEALALGSFIMILVALASYPEAHAMISAGVLRGSGKTTQVAVYSFISITLLRPIITAFFLYYLNMGLTGAWLALLIDQSIRAVCAHVLLNRLKL